MNGWFNVVEIGNVFWLLNIPIDWKRMAQCSLNICNKKLKLINCRNVPKTFRMKYGTGINIFY